MRIRRDRHDRSVVETLCRASARMTDPVLDKFARGRTENVVRTPGTDRRARPPSSTTDTGFRAFAHVMAGALFVPGRIETRGIQTPSGLQVAHLDTRYGLTALEGPLPYPPAFTLPE